MQKFVIPQRLDFMISCWVRCIGAHALQFKHPLAAVTITVLTWIKNAK